MLRRLIALAAAAVGLAVSSVPATADIIYEQLPGANSDYAPISSTLDAAGRPPGYRSADNFVLRTGALITDVHWWGIPNTAHPGGNDFQFTFYSNNAGVPGTVLLTTGGSLTMTTVDVGSPLDPVQYPIIYYSSDLTTPFNATAGTTYWVSIFNQAADASWAWLRANNAGDGSRQGPNPGPPWFVTDLDSPPNLAFQLTSTPTTAVPAPPAIALAGIGLVGVAVRRFVRREPKPELAI